MKTQKKRRHIFLKTVLALTMCLCLLTACHGKESLTPFVIP